MSVAAQVIQFPKGKQVVTTEAGSGYIKLHRKLLDEPFMRCPVKSAVWSYLLLNATHKPYQTMLGTAKVVLAPGQLISGRNKILKECFDQKLIKVTEDMVRGALDFFKREEMITTKATRKGTVFTIVNWVKYQGEKGDFSPQQIPNTIPQQETQNNSSNNNELDGVTPNAIPNTTPVLFPTIQEDNNLNRDTNVSLGSTDVETESGKSASKSSFEYPEQFDWIWQNRPRREGGDPKRKAFHACNARLKQGATWRELAEGMKRYARFCETKGILNTSHVQQMATFFGPDEHYKNDWKVNHGASSTHRSASTAGAKLSTVDRQHAAANAYLAGLQGQRPSEDFDDSVVVTYE